MRQLFAARVRRGSAAQDHYSWTPLLHEKGSGCVFGVGVIEWSLNDSTTHYNRMGMTT
ncbi:MAG: hypothetical protein WBN81_02155 [Gammaproteobacteria bacterium]